MYYGRPFFAFGSFSSHYNSCMEMLGLCISFSLKKCIKCGNKQREHKSPSCTQAYPCLHEGLCRGLAMRSDFNFSSVYLDNYYLSQIFIFFLCVEVVSALLFLFGACSYPRSLGMPTCDCRNIMI